MVRGKGTHTNTHIRTKRGRRGIQSSEVHTERKQQEMQLVELSRRPPVTCLVSLKSMGHLKHETPGDGTVCTVRAPPGY